MLELRLHGREVGTVFDLLGEKENDVTYAAGWALSRSERLLQTLLSDVLGEDAGQPTVVRLQEYGPEGGGFTDIEVETDRQRLVIEAKRGWDLPGRAQLEKYAPRVEKLGGAILVVSECTTAYAKSQQLPTEVDGIPVLYRRWHDIAQMADEEAKAKRVGLFERRLLDDLVRYLRGLMTMQDATSNMVYVVSLGTKPLGDSGLTFKDIVVDHDRYFHPIGGGPGGWPKDPPNYLGFRFHGRLQQIRHVDGYDLTEEPWGDLPQLKDNIEWTPSPHFAYTLGPPIEPGHEIKMGKLWPNARVWAAMDLLLTSTTVAEARDLTRTRLEAVGSAG